MVISTFQGHLEVKNKKTIKKDRCSEQNAVSKCSMDLKIKDEENRYYAAAKRYEVILSGASYDLFALDLYYHKTCYVNFTNVYDKNIQLLIK